MSTAIEFDQVWKKFRKGEKFNSLRDAIPNFLRRSIKQKSDNSLEDQEFWVVKNVSFTIEHGSVVGIMGPNGAGKSTILKLLSGIMNPTQGRIKINGRLSALIEVTAGFHPELTGRENVYLNATILGMTRKEIDNKFDEIVEFSGVSDFIDTPVKRYSSGMYSRLGFSVAAHMNPEILIVDEVLSVGDIAFQAKCSGKIRELLNSGATIVLVSHQLSMIQSLCKRVILLNHGEVLKEGPTDEVIPHYQNIILKNNEDQIKNKIASMGERVQINTQALVDITTVHFMDEKDVAKEKFMIGETAVLNVDYIAHERIETPIFVLDIVRSDGVLCCSLKSNDVGFKTPSMKGAGGIKINLGKMLLGPGIYMVKVSIWDREMIHPYAIHNKEIIRVETKGRMTHADPIFVPETTWTLKNEK